LFILTIGLVTASTTMANLLTAGTLTNLLLLAFMVPITILRIDLEEQLLVLDPAYAAYCTRTRYRLLPFVY
jgi:protein-S-isoprenylcysteine O-methyltransferase Ste14